MDPSCYMSFIPSTMFSVTMANAVFWVFFVLEEEEQEEEEGRTFAHHVFLIYNDWSRFLKLK